MATPTKTQAGSTPKNPLSSTPSRPMASPRPATSGVGYKTLAYKSPAVKTPSSLHGHGQHLSVSSQPSSTPLAPGNIHDELLALNSPAAALINSIAPTGLTPISSVQDGLGITTHLQGNTRDGQVARNPEVERLQRLQQVADTLKSKVIGQGITRDGIERVAKLQGFEALLDEDSLTIAGNSVEIEMNFYPKSKDRVSDLVLKLNSAGGEEAQVQQAATDILKKDVGVSSLSAQLPPGRNLEAFAANLQYLSQLDRVDSTTNCFELVGGLFNTFKRIWEEEKKRMQWRSDDQHLCNGNVGRATMDRKPKLGLCVDYWKNRHQIPHEKVHSTTNVSRGVAEDVWTARLSCEAGDPSITPLQQWTSDEILVKEQLRENVLDADDEVLRPDWRDNTSHLTIGIEDGKDGEDVMNVDKPDVTIPQPINVRFACALEPEVFLPIGTAMGLNTEVRMLDIDQAQATTYQQALQIARNAQLYPNDRERVDVRWNRSFLYVDSQGTSSPCTQSYALYPATSGAELWFYPVSKLRFGHPRQFAAALPTLRQYAILWSLLRTLVVEPCIELRPQAESQTPNGAAKPVDRRRVKKRTNAKRVTEIGDTFGPAEDDSLRTRILPVDMSLDVMSDPSKPKLNLFAPINSSTKASRRSHFLNLSLVIGLDGKIEVVGLDGYDSSDEASLRAKLARMLSVTEDIGMVLQWLSEKLRSDTGS